MRHLLEIVIAAILALVLSGGSVFAASDSIVISQVFTGGGDGGSRISNDYIELFNRGSSTVNLTGWVLYYAPGTSVTFVAIPLSGSMAPGSYYLIRGGGGGFGGSIPIRFDISSPVNFEQNGGRIALFNMEVTLTQCPAIGTEGLVDLVGYGDSSCSESFRAPELTNRDSIILGSGGCIDTDRNGADFTLLPSPFLRNSLSGRNPCDGASSDASRTLSLAQAGGTSLQSSGASQGIAVGSATIQPTGEGSAGTGMAIFALRDSRGVLTEATVPAAPLVQGGLFYAMINGPVNTGLAIVNPNSEDVTISFSLIESDGRIRSGEPVTISKGSQIARFLTELPWGLPAPFEGTILFNSNAPVGITVLRGLTNERGDFLITTLPILDPSVLTASGPAFIPHFAANGGWKTEIILINSSSTTSAGTLDFFNSVGDPTSVRIGSLTGSSIDYSVNSQSSLRLTVSGVAQAAIQSGSIRVTPVVGATPSAMAIFAFNFRGVTVSESGVAAVRGTAFRTYAEFVGTPGAADSISSGFAISNASTTFTDVQLELLRLDGTSTGLGTTIRILGLGQVAKFLHEIFPTLASPFQGILRISTPGGAIAVVGLRGRYNQTRDFLLTTTPPQNEFAPVSSATLYFPHIVDSGGYTTQFVILNGAPSRTSSAVLRFSTIAGRPLVLDLR